MRNRIISIATILLLAPSISRAQATLFDILIAISGVLQSLFRIAVLLAVAAFFWGMAVFIFRAGSEQGREQGKRIMIWGVITLFVIVSIWSIVALLGTIFGVDQGGTCPPPQIGTNNVSTC